MNSNTTEHTWPGDVPENLTQPSRTYKKQLILAMAGLLLFIGIYIALTIWFCHTSYRLFDSAFNSSGGFLEGLVAVFNGILAIFMIKSLFISNKSDQSHNLEITEQDEPKLFAFLNELADKAGAPRPHKVYLSNMVNAMVFYDLKFWNLLFPSKKNLEIGLGLINVLNLGEFKAVLAHEFGHFAQRSMLLGRWVYIAHQIAVYIIAKRDALDNVLSVLSRIDIRIAWIGWILSLIVWSIRSIVDMLFRVVIIAHRALSREMEFHADLVAVSLTGSDALIHALHKLRAADQALEDALATANAQLFDEKAVKDLYILQSNAIEQTARILDNPEYGRSPDLPETDRSKHRIFKSKIAQPPKMWATHPADNDREDNAKRTYVEASINSGSSWELFQNPKETRLKLTKMLLDTAEKKATSELSDDEALSAQNKKFEKDFLDTKYRGLYLKQPITRHIKSPDEFFEQAPGLSLDDLKEQLADVYPESLNNDLEELEDVSEELGLLMALKENVLTAPGGVITHRGDQIKRRDLPKIIETVEAETEVSREKVLKHVDRVRALHLKAAAHLGRGWAAYLEGLIRLIHYTEHTEANILDLNRIFQNVLYVAMADGKVTASELTKILNEARALRTALNGVYSMAKNGQVQPSEPILKKLAVDSWNDALEDFGLGHPDHDNINQWLQVVGSWVAASTNALGNLRSAALEELLVVEAKMAGHILNGTQIEDDAPPPCRVAEKYFVLNTGNERPIIHKLSAWDKFIMADGTFAAIVRSAAAILIVGTAVGFSAITKRTASPHNSSSSSFSLFSSNEWTVYMYNGLGNTMVVSVDGDDYKLAPHRSDYFNTSDSIINFSTYSQDGQFVESYEAHLDDGYTRYVYNVAKASALVEWTAYYGETARQPEVNTVHGNPRWVRVMGDVVLREPPNTIQTFGGIGGRKEVFSAYSDINANSILTYLDEAEQKELVYSRAIWDTEDSESLLDWMTLAQRMGLIKSVVKARISRNNDDLAALKWEQDLANEGKKQKLCDAYNQLSGENPDNADYYYLKCRCIENEAQKNSAYISGNEQWPNHGWLAYSAALAYIGEQKWKEALVAFDKAGLDAPYLKKHATVNMERIKRRLGSSEYQYINYSDGNDFLELIEMIESGKDATILQGPLLAYHLLHQGSIDQVSLANNERNIMILAAASDGAPSSLIEEAVNAPVELSIDENNIWSAIGLRIKKGMSIDEYEYKLGEIHPDIDDTVSTFIEHLQRGNYKEAEEEMKKVSLWTMAEMCCLARVAYGDRIPAHWRENAKHLLFCTERPYFE